MEDYRTGGRGAGGRIDAGAHGLAFEGLSRYFMTGNVLSPADTDWGLELLVDPIRLELNDNVSLTYGEASCASYDITLHADIEHHNFGGVPADTLLGWAEGPATDLFRAQDMGGRCAVAKIVRVEEGRLYTARPLKLFMITNNAAIAESDCLFYAVEDDGSDIPSTVE